MFENIRLSFQGIWSHKMRSFLTMLGIIIGIAAIIAIVSTIKGTNEQIKENLIGSGENTVEVSLYQGEWEYEMDYNGVPQGVPLVTDDVMSDIKDLDHVVNASAYLSRQDYSGYGFRKCPVPGRRSGRKYDRDPERALYGNWNRDKGEGVRAGHQFH